MQRITGPATKQGQPIETKVTNQAIKLEGDVQDTTRFPWYPPQTISQRVANYRNLRFIRSSARSPLPEDLLERKSDSFK